MQAHDLSARYSRSLNCFVVTAEISHGDLLNSKNYVCSQVTFYLDKVQFDTMIQRFNISAAQALYDAPDVTGVESDGE